jgi:hypothetical protein
MRLKKLVMCLESIRDAPISDGTSIATGFAR